MTNVALGAYRRTDAKGNHTRRQRMTVEEMENAIAFLKAFRQLDENLHKTSPKDSIGYHATKTCLKFWDIAIGSIRALEKVKEEIKDLDLDFADVEYQAGVAYGIMKVTDIINKHLKEIADGDNG